MTDAKRKRDQEKDKETEGETETKRTLKELTGCSYKMSKRKREMEKKLSMLYSVSANSL